MRGGALTDEGLERPLRLLYLIDSLVPGGAEHALLSHAAPLVRRGVRLDVAYLKERSGLQGKLEEAGATVLSLDGAGGYAGWLLRFVSLVRERRPQLVHTTLFDANVVGRLGAALTRTPVVSSMVNVQYGAEQRRAPNLKSWKVQGARLLDAATARQVARFHAVTTAVADEMAARLHVPRHQVEVIHRGRDPELLGHRSQERRALVRQGLGVDVDTPLLLAAARHEHQKGLDILCEALPLVQARVPVTTVIAGREGNQTPRLREALTRLGSSVRLLGNRDDVPDLLCAADVFVLPSRWEGIAGILLEAMALQAPIVASDLPGVREVLLGSEHAHLVPPQDPGRLADAIVDTLEDPRAASARAARARDRFLEHFTIDRVTDQMMSFYERALGRE